MNETELRKQVADAILAIYVADTVFDADKLAKTAITTIKSIEAKEAYEKWHGKK